MDPVPEIVQKQSKHDGLRYGCDKCDYNAKKMEALKVTNSPYTKAWRMAVTSTIMKLHENVKLKKHKESKHDDLNYVCGNCDFTKSRK